MAITENLSALLKSYSAEFESRKDRIRNLIGTAHWPSDGRMREEVLRAFIRPYLPNDLDIANGFIRTVEQPALISREIDIIVFDRALSPPLFNEPWLIVATPPGVRAHIHVKSALSGAVLSDALDVARSAGVAVGPNGSRGQVFGAIFFWDGASWSVPEIAEELRKQLVETVKQRTNGGLSGTPMEVVIPSLVAVLGVGVCYLTVKSHSIEIRGFDCSNVVPGVLLGALASHLIDRTKGFQAPVSLTTPLDEAHFAVTSLSVPF